MIKQLGLDVLVVQEMLDQAGVNQFLNKIMNYSVPGTYAAAPFFDGPDTDNALFYKKSATSLIFRKQIPTDLRDISEYVLKVKSGPGKGTVFRIYSIHLKAGTSSADKKARENEAKILRNYLNGLQPKSLFLVCGDLNLYSSREAAFQVLIGNQADNDGRANDPVNKPGIWHDRSIFANIHTQSTRTTSFGGGATGGLDDRFDMILISDALLTSTKLVYVPRSYIAYGNDGKHFNKAVNSGVNSSVSPEIAYALWQASDHLPVVIELLPQTGGIPKAPSNLTAKSISSSEINLTWKDNSNNETGFKIERQTTSNWTQIAKASTNTTTYSNSGLSYLSTYSYRVKSF